MPEAPRYESARAARRDLIEIWRFTEARWSEAQAEAYFDALIAECARLAAEPALGRVVAEAPAYRRRPVRAHVVVYRESEAGIFVLRILHKSMDIVRHRPPPDEGRGG